MFMGALAFITIAWQAGPAGDLLRRRATLALAVRSVDGSRGLVMYLEPFANRSKWDAWKRHMEGMSFGDMLLMCHIPQLR
jgi:hypothetical protein